MHKMLVLAKAVDGRTDELAHWYDTRHLDDLLAVPGFVSAERHRLVPLQGPPGLPKWDFMLIYTFDGDPMPVLASMNGIMGSERMPRSDALESAQTLSAVGMSEGLRTNAEATPPSR